MATAEGEIERLPAMTDLVKQVVRDEVHADAAHRAHNRGIGSPPREPADGARRNAVAVHVQRLSGDPDVDRSRLMDRRLVQLREDPRCVPHAVRRHDHDLIDLEPLAPYASPFHVVNGDGFLDECLPVLAAALHERVVDDDPEPDRLTRCIR